LAKRIKKTCIRTSHLAPRISQLLFLLALGIEVLYIRSYNVSHFISPDGLLYSNIAENFLKGNGLINTVGFVQEDGGSLREIARTREYVVGPIYPLLLAFIYGIFGFKSYSMVVMLQAVLGAASAVLAYKTGELLFGKGYAWIPFGLTLGYPLFAFWGMYVLTETTYVLTINLFLYLLARYTVEAKQPKLRTLLILGAATGISNLVRPLLLLYFPVLGLWIWWIQRGNLKTAFRDFTIILIMTVLVMSPWWIRNGIKYQQFIPVSNYGSYEFYLGNNPLTVTDNYFYFAQPSYDPDVKARIEKLPVLEQEKEYKRLGMAYILQHPVKFVQRTLSKEKNLFWQPVTPVYGESYKMRGYSLDQWYLLLGLAGIVLSFFHFKKYSFLVFFTVYYSFIVSMITVVSGGRYRLPVMPALVLFASLALVMAIKGIGRLAKVNPGSSGRG